VDRYFLLFLRNKFSSQPVQLSMTQYIQRPLIPLAAAAFLGCLAGSSLPLGRPLFWLLTGALLLPASFFTRKRGAGFPWLLLAAFLIFCGLAIRAGFIQPDDISCWAPRRDILLQGTLADIPRSSPDIPRWSATLVCSSAEWHGQRGQTSGRVQVSFPGFAPAWNPGDLIQVQGKLFLPAEPANPGEFNYVAFLDAKGVRACLSSVFPGDAIRLRTASYGHWGRVAGGLYRWLSQEIRKSTPPWAAGWVNGLVTGDRSGINAWAGERLAAAGLAHLLAVSGMNVSIIFVTLLSIGAFLRVPRSLALGPALAGILLLVLCTGGQPPVVRAAWMTLCIAACYFAGRAPDSLSGLSFSAIVILACDPLACRDAGFQLSYTATIAILVVLPIFHAMPRLCFGFRWLLESLLISTAALLLTLPLTLYYFYSAVPVALLTNLAAVPILDIVVISGLLAGLLHGLLPFMATLSGWIAGQAVGLLEAITRLALRIPAGRIFIYPPPVWWVVGFYMALGLLAWKPARGLGLAAVGIALLIYPLYQPASPPPRVWRVTFLSLNIGEATLVESPSGSRLLLDTGTEEEFLRRVKPVSAVFKCGLC
jgi:ComEC/Rec2-related protein